MTTVLLCGCLVTIWIRESFTSSFDSVSSGRNRTGHLICAQASSKCKSQTVSMLSEAGAPLQAPLALTTEEAVALILSYEALPSFGQAICKRNPVCDSQAACEYSNRVLS